MQGFRHKLWKCGINCIYTKKTRANRRKLEFMRDFEIIEDEETLNSILDTP